jgi:hypothetical protein
LTKEAERVKQNRVRTILAVLFLAVEKIALLKLPALGCGRINPSLLSYRSLAKGNKQPATTGPGPWGWQGGERGGRERGK